MWGGIKVELCHIPTIMNTVKACSFVDILICKLQSNDVDVDACLGPFYSV